ncbi:MAG: hypothetical protein AB7J32_07570 [Pseudonocardia sp.]
MLHTRAAAQLTRSIIRRRLSADRRGERRHHTAYYRQLWTAAAAHVDAPIRAVEDGYLEITLATLTVRVRGTHCSIDDRDALQRAGDKVLVHRLLAQAGLPAPEHLVFTLPDLHRARRFLAEAPAACVVKPGQDSAAGAGVTTGVRTDADLASAAAVAAEAAARTARIDRSGNPLAVMATMYGQLPKVPLLIERQVPGANYRLLFLDGELVDAIRRGVPSVVGDGLSTVAELLKEHNEQRLREGGVRGQLLVSQDLDCRRTLAEQGLTLSSVPAAGAAVRIKTTINQTAADTNSPAADELDSSIIADAAQAARIVGVRWAGVDVLTPDPSVPLAESGGRILEVNTTPGLAMHHHGKPGQVEPAKVLLERLCESVR